MSNIDQTSVNYDQALINATHGKSKSYSQDQINLLDPATWGNGPLHRDDGVVLYSDGNEFYTTQSINTKSHTISYKLNGGSVPNGTASALVWGVTLKGRCDFDFDQMRITVVCSSGNAVSGVQSLVATTEIGDTVTASDVYIPTVNGVDYNSKVGASDAYGFRDVTWDNGNASSGAVAGASTRYSPEFLTSDWVDCSSVPPDAATAITHGDDARFFITRVRFPNAATAGWSFVSLDAETRVATAANRGQIVACTATDSDNISNPATASEGLQNITATIIVELRSRKKGASVACIGDSTFENSALLTERPTNWLQRACSDASTNNIKVQPYNLGCSGQDELTYLGYAKKCLDAIPCNIAFYQVFTSNTGTFSRRTSYDLLSRAQEFLAYCEANKITPILTTSMPYHALTLVQDNERKFVDDEVRKITASGAAVLCDFDVLLSDGASPARWVVGLDFGDGIHPSESTIDTLLATAAKNAIKRAMHT